MRIALYSAVILLLALIGALLAAPFAIDWNARRGQIAGWAGQATGQPVDIGGRIEVTLLPAPALSVEALSVGDWLSVGLVEARFALLPLLSGRYEIAELVLRGPVLRLAAMPAVGPDIPAIAVPRLRIREGQVVGDRVNATAIDATFALRSLAGPLTGSGDFRLGEVPLSAEISAGAFAAGRNTPVQIELRAGDGVALLNGRGSMQFAPELRGSGRLTVSAADLAAAARLAGATLPALLRLPLAAEGEIELDRAGVAWNDARVRIGETLLTGAASVVLGTRPRIDVTAHANRFDLDGLLGRAAPSDERPWTPPWQILAGLDGSIGLSVSGTVWRDALIQQATLEGTLAGGAFQVARLSASLPGGSDLYARGRVDLGEGPPRFAGRVEGGSDNLRALLGWLGADASAVAGDRLRALQLAAEVSGGADEVAVSGLDLRIDTMRVTGSLALPGGRHDLLVDRLDLDAYGRLLAVPENAAGQLRVGELLWRGHALREASLALALADGIGEARVAAAGGWIDGIDPARGEIGSGRASLIEAQGSWQVTPEALRTSGTELRLEGGSLTLAGAIDRRSGVLSLTGQLAPVDAAIAIRGSLSDPDVALKMQ